MTNRLVAFTLALALHVPGCVQADNGDQMAVQRPRPPVTSLPAPAVEAPGAPGEVDLPRFPSISPDGSQIVFSWRGDLWKVASTGGHAVRLTMHPGDDLRSAWSADGTRIAFDSNRHGGHNLFLMNDDGTGVRQVTDVDKNCTLAGMGVDADGNEVVTFAASIEDDGYQSPRPYQCSTGGGEIRRIHDAFGSDPKAGPDGRYVSFTRGGSSWSRRGYRGPDAREVWTFDRAEGSFARLTHWEGNDGMACWAGARSLIFASDRELKCANLYRMDASVGDGGAVRLTSFTDADVQDLDVSADGSTAVMAVWDKLYTLALNEAGAEAVPLSITANQDEADNFQIKSIDREVSEAALSPDGKVLACVAYGEIYVRNIEEKSPTRRVTDAHARDRNIAWSPDGLKLYFVSDRDGTDSIYAATVAMTREEVKTEFEKATKPVEEPTTRPAEEAETTDEEEQEPASQPTTQPTTAPSDPADARPEPSREPEAEEEADEDPDKAAKEDDDKKEDKQDDLPKELQAKRWQDALTFNVEPVVVSEHNDRDPRPSPDGKTLSFRRGRGDLMLMDIESGQVRTFVSGWDTSLDWRWSPDGRHIAYHQNDLNFNADIWIAPVDGSKPAVNVTRHPDNDLNPRWSADGKILSFISERVNEEYDLWMVYLDDDLEVSTPREFQEYYDETVKAAKKRKPLKVKKPEKKEQKSETTTQPSEPTTQPQTRPATDGAAIADPGGGAKQNDSKPGDDAGKEAKDKKPDKPLELDLEDAYLRLRRVTTLGDNEENNEITPGGERYIFTATIGDRGLYSVKWDGEDRQRLADAASVQHVSLTGDKIVLVSKGRAGTVGPEGKKLEYVDPEDRIRIDLQQQAEQKFVEMARVVGENFYHPTLKGLDWPALTARYLTLACQTRTASEFNHVGSRLLGELNGSHLGVFTRSPESPNVLPQGRLGTVHHRVDDGYEVTEVVDQSPASKGPMALKVGDVITAIDLKPFGATDTVESRLAGRVDQETLVTISRSMEDGATRSLNVLITPIGAGGLAQLKYRAWRQANAAKVEQWSGGRIGYIHVQAMGQSALDVFERDLFAAVGDKEGLIIDVRNNGGGWTADRLLSSIMVQPHAYTLPRGADPGAVGHYPQDRLFIQRYTLPINMLCNEKSFSNAEIVAHAFKTLGRGKLVGMQTYGGVISTGGTGLIDGTMVRLPFRGWYLLDGTDMENNGAIPDLLVPQTPEAESRNQDEQLRAAVEDLLTRL